MFDELKVAIVTFILEIVFQFIAILLKIVGILASFAGVIVILLGFLVTYIQRYIQYDLEGNIVAILEQLYLPESFQSLPIWVYGAVVIGVGVFLIALGSVIDKHIGK